MIFGITLHDNAREGIRPECFDCCAHAEAHSESVNGFINRAIDEAIERDESAPAASEGHL